MNVVEKFAILSSFCVKEKTLEHRMRCTSHARISLFLCFKSNYSRFVSTTSCNLHVNEITLMENQVESNKCIALHRTLNEWYA